MLQLQERHQFQEEYASPTSYALHKLFCSGCWENISHCHGLILRRCTNTYFTVGGPMHKVELIPIHGRPSTRISTDSHHCITQVYEVHLSNWYHLWCMRTPRRVTSTTCMGNSHCICAVNAPTWIQSQHYLFCCFPPIVPNLPYSWAKHWKEKRLWKFYVSGTIVSCKKYWVNQLQNWHTDIWYGTNNFVSVGSKLACCFVPRPAMSHRSGITW